MKAHLAHLFTLVLLVTGGTLLLFYFLAPENHFANPREGFGIALSPAVNVDTLTLGLDTQQRNPELDISVNVHLLYVPVNERKPAYVMLVLPFHVNTVLISQRNPQRWKVIHNSKVTSSIVYTQVSNDSLHLNATAFWGQFLVDRTYESSQRGIYTIVLPFGAGVSGERFPDIDRVQEQLGVAFRTLPASSMYVYLTMPLSAENVQAFPEPRSRTPYEYSNQTQISVEWVLAEQQTVTISYENSYEKSAYDAFVILGSLLVGVGFSGVLDYLEVFSRTGDQG